MYSLSLLSEVVLCTSFMAILKEYGHTLLYKIKLLSLTAIQIFFFSSDICLLSLSPVFPLKNLWVNIYFFLHCHIIRRSSVVAG